jgi:Kelch motif/Galactose oxidase, central domain
MTAGRDFDQQLRSWLDGRATSTAPDDLLARSLARVSATSQRPGWLVRDRGPAGAVPRTAHGKSAFARIAVMAAVGAIAVGGALYVVGAGRPAGIGTPGVSISPSPSPTLSPTPSPTATAAAGPTGPMSVGRQIHTATLLADGRVLVAGGYDANDLARAEADLYDPTTDTFSPTGAMATARGMHTATLLADGRVLVAGGGPEGWAGDYTYLRSAELYDPRTGTFSPTGPMVATREYHTATLLLDGRVLIAGGNDAGDRAVASAEVYDPKTGTFSPTGPMATARGFHTATLLADGRVLIAGGDPAAWTSGGPFLASAEIYDPRTGTFSPTGSLVEGRAEHAATLLADGRVLVTGGTDTGAVSLASAEIYDPSTGTFTATGSMSDGRVYQTATLLPDGRVLVAGGCPNGRVYSSNPQKLASAEVYDPMAGTFSPTGPMTDGRTFHRAVLLADGRVLVTGGYGDVAPLATAEIYDPATGTFSPAGAGP